MSALLETPEIAISEEEMGKITGLDHLLLRRLQPDGFGMPGHWRMNKQGGLVYTQKGAEELVRSLEARDFQAAAVCLRAKLKELTETPSLGHFARAMDRTRPWFQKGGME